MIIVMKPGAVGCSPGFLSAIRPRARPSLHQRPIEPFNFSVDLPSVRPGAPVLHIQPQRLSERRGTVAGTVIGHHLGHRNARCRKETSGSFPKPSRGFLLLVVEDLANRPTSNSHRPRDAGTGSPVMPRRPGVPRGSARCWPGGLGQIRAHGHASLRLLGCGPVS